MKTLSEKQIEHIFQELSENISPVHRKALVGLEKLTPARHKHQGLEWRYRLGGYIEGLCAGEVLSVSGYENIIERLFSQRIKDKDVRSGREYKYSVDITTEQNKIFTFDVPSMNPVDAYVQLTKRIAYKTIPGIKSVLVYSGFQSERQPGSKPLRTFENDELVYVTLV